MSLLEWFRLFLRFLIAKLKVNFQPFVHLPIVPNLDNPVHDLVVIMCLLHLHAIKIFCCTVFSLYKNVVFPAQAEYSYFSADLRLDQEPRLLGWRYS